jgi:LysM repeat protein
MSLDSKSPPELLSENRALPHACPYLGLRNDLTIRYGYPQSQNCCHRAKPSQPVVLSQQSGVCLGGSQAYQNCPVNNDAWQGALPADLAGDELAKFSRPGWHYYAAAGLGLVILLVIGLVIFKPSHAAGSLPIETATQAGVVPVTASPTAEKISASATQNGASTVTSRVVSLTPTSTATPKPPTATISPTQTATPISLTPTIGPGLETPLGPKGEYIVHQLLDGENLDNLAVTYRTTSDVIRAINQPKNHVIWAGTPLVVIVGEVNVKNVRPLQAIWLDTDTRLSYLAEKYGMPIAELLQLNSLGSGDTARSQRWMVVWR